VQLGLIRTSSNSIILKKNHIFETMAQKKRENGKEPAVP